MKKSPNTSQSCIRYRRQTKMDIIKMTSHKDFPNLQDSSKSWNPASFINTCPQTKDSSHTTTHSMQEIENALTFCTKMVWISYVKETRFENESRGSNLEYSELEEGCNSLLSYQVMHQISPAGHNFTRLVVLAEHIRLHHAGPQLLTSYILQRY